MCLAESIETFHADTDTLGVGGFDEATHTLVLEDFATLKGLGVVFIDEAGTLTLNLHQICNIE